MKTQSTSIIFLLAAILLLAGSCKKESNETASSKNTNNPGTTGGGFTPPASNYYIIDTAHHQSSMDAVSCSLGGGDVGLVKSFGNIGVYSANLHITFPQTGSSGMRDINAQVAEGAYVAFDIDSVGKASNQAAVEVDLQYNGEYYYLTAKTGKLYVSKLNGKLRYTTDGTLNVNGPKWASGFVWNYTRQLKFSIECGAQF